MTTRLVQHLNTVVLATNDALSVNIDSPSLDLYEDPSSAGPASSWGSGTLFLDPDTGEVVTGTTQGTRVPRGPDGQGRHVRDHGSGVQPNKNTLTEAQRTVAPGKCYQGEIVIRITGPAGSSFLGQEPSFVGHGCVATGGLSQYSPGLYAPTTAEIVPIATDYLGIGGTPSMAIITYAKLWLRAKVGAAATGFVISDLVSPDPGTTCTRGVDCSAPTPSVVPSAAATGTTITAA